MLIEAEDWLDVPISLWPWPNFTPEEMACRESREIKIDAAFMEKLQGLRDIIAAPLIITSGYRSPDHDVAVGGSGVHPTGRAADILCHGPKAIKVAKIALQMFPGVGINQKGPHKGRFIHVDMMPPDDPARPRPWIWTY